MSQKTYLTGFDSLLVQLIQSVKKQLALQLNTHLLALALCIT